MFKSFHNNRICLLHFPGQQKNTYAEKIEELSNAITVKKPDDISIVSIMTPDVIEKSPLHRQLTNSGIKYYNADIQKRWINKHKPRYVLEALSKIETPYALVTDGNDVVFVDDLDLLIDPFLGYEKKIIFNATSNRFPDIQLDFIPFVDTVPGTRQILFGPFCYLNAGVCFGYKQALIDFYTMVDEIAKYESVPSEQYYVRKVFNEVQDEVFFDYDCRMFQAFNRGIELKEDEENVVKITPPEPIRRWRSRSRYEDLSKQ